MGWGGVAMIFLIAYDISADRRRNRVAKLLQSWGYRIQESVFQLRVTQADISVIIEDLGKIIDPKDDVIHVYALCSSCEQKAQILGVGIALDDVGFCHGVW